MKAYGIQYKINFQSGSNHPCNLISIQKQKEAIQNSVQNLSLWMLEIFYDQRIFPKLCTRYYFPINISFPCCCFVLFCFFLY